MDLPAPDDLVYISATLPKREPAHTLKEADLPTAWWTDNVAAGAATTRDLGDKWLRGSTSLALMVPSLPIRAEWNVLVNPLHPSIAELRIDAPQPFIFDARMFQQTGK
jgi:RES domain-containing protein